MTKTQLELQAKELWKTQEQGAEVTPDHKFWKQYDKLIKASRKVTFKPPTVIQAQALDTITAYKQLPQRYYGDLFKKSEVFSSRAVLVSTILASNIGLNLIPSYKLWGALALFGGVFILRYLGITIFKTGQVCSLEIQSDCLKFKTKQQQKIPFEHIVAFSIENQVLKISARFPKKNRWNKERNYEVPLVKAKNQPLSKDEITAIYQLLDAIIKENELQKNNG
ncbi:MAG TPA: hypothetical protein DCS93_12135 [Microscillaceae bacterium]|nr:hypothetical protein [Microscillaceae bacterium]